MSIVYEEADIDTMLADMGVPVTIGASVVKAIVDMPDESLLAQGAVKVAGRMISALFKTADVPTLAPEDALTIDGVNYTVRERLRRDEGGMVRVLCLQA